MERPDGVVDFTPDPDLYPFESKWFESSVGPIHYIDEGEGRPLFLIHGNPDWSFLYRKIIAQLTGEFRCVAADLPGFGLSSHPDGYGYTPAEHAGILSELVDHLDLTDMVLMGQDWGGPIGMEIASLQPDRVAALVMGNTWFWPATDRTMRTFARVMDSPPLQHLIKRHNLFVTVAMKRALQTPISDQEFNHYAAVAPTPESRSGFAVFPGEIVKEKAWFEALESRVAANLGDKPILLFFGHKDPMLAGDSFVEHWNQAFPDATVVELPDAGHFIQHDAPDEIADAIRAEFASADTPSEGG